ncbi:histidine kinase [Pseudoduganella sp. LjRoot289]|uniref:sensor histidine kinase n=1 Tax=Pseudoduganella sp. LjRoot289 TaxID=3342314 RepID=UPI003ECD8913
MKSRRAAYALSAAWLLFWTLMVVTAVQDALRDGEQAVWKPMLWELSSALIATLLMLAQRLRTRRHDHLLASPLRWFGMQLRWAPVYWIAFVPLTFGIRHGVYALMGARYGHEAWPQVFLYEDVKISVFFGLFVLIQFGLLSYRALMDERLRAEQANALLRQAQLQQLTQQMQPHFLFNALNTISSLMHTDVERADATLMQLADVLRATLEHSGQQQAPLATELRLLRGYAQLMSERYVDRVSIAWHIDESLLGCLVPLMSMQPLLENVFKHTVEQRRQPTGIDIRAYRDGAQLVMRVDDDGGRLPAARHDGQDSGNSIGGGNGRGGCGGGDNGNGSGGDGGGGIGLRNLRERLAVLHGGSASLRLEQLEPAGVRAEVRLPCAC